MRSIRTNWVTRPERQPAAPTWLMRGTVTESWPTECRVASADGDAVLLKHSHLYPQRMPPVGAVVEVEVVGDNFVRSVRTIKRAPVPELETDDNGSIPF